ncbi:right-handed parallel beta-helix repeat-containing protein [Micromonospora purpureochromogenes]|uniref:right-handed parallel beta-helix repeat-containing protein n=1 Tax=Micromonospora purpureochromogenes TaxID=47872 RepID=UPI00332D976B
MAGLGLVGPTAPAVAAPPPVTQASGSELYVSVKDCASGADGSYDAPFCTISAAAAAAQPGQTVLVQPGDYPETVSLTRSGSSGAPITFRAVNGPDGSVRVGYVGGNIVPGTVFSLVGVHDVAVEGFTVLTPETVVPVLVDDASDVTLDGLAIRAANAPALVRVTGASSDVTVSRGWFQGTADGVSVEAGVTGAVVTASTFSESRMLVTDAPGTVITGNTVVLTCRQGISVTGASPGVSLRNNIVQTAAGTPSIPQACADPTTATAISVSAASTSQTTADHNLIDPTGGGAPYHWGGTDHATLAAFRAATGQGGHDIAAPPRLRGRSGGERGWYPLLTTSPAIDSADATAPGVTATDLLNNPHADPPEIANTGTGNGYHDRGAVEMIGWGDLRGYDIRRKVGGGPLDVVARMGPIYKYPMDGSVSMTAFKFSDDRYWRVGTATSMSHTFRRAGLVSVVGRVNYTGFRDIPGSGTGRLHTVVGANYTPVAPTRLLDTRAALGVPTTTPVPGNSEVVLPIERVGGTSAADITAVVLNVTATQPTTAGFLTVYPDGATLPNASNVNFVPKETVPNLVTVPMSNGKIRIRNSGGGTAHVVADLQGFYSGGGSGFEPLAPRRVLDTRSAGNTAVPANTTRQLDLSGTMPADATAAILNVTVTKPAADGVLKVFPGGASVPVASNLNFVTGQTIPNLVVVPVVGGRVSIHNQSSGATHVVADLAGYYGSAASGATDSYVPNGPVRIIDTRNNTGLPERPLGMPLQPDERLIFRPQFERTSCWGDCPAATGGVFNLTVTKPTQAGFLTMYPSTDAQPPNASNVNFVGGETASNLATVNVGQFGTVRVHNNSRGSAHLVVDQTGYFIGPAS